MTQIDPFASFQKDPIPSFTRHALITPSDDDDLPVRPMAIRNIGVVYDSVRQQNPAAVIVRDEEGNDIEYWLEYGEYLFFRPLRILETGTTEGAILVAYW